MIPICMHCMDFNLGNCLLKILFMKMKTREVSFKLSSHVQWGDNTQIIRKISIGNSIAEVQLKGLAWTTFGTLKGITMDLINSKGHL